MSKSIYNKPKAGKMRIKMRSRIHVVLVRVSEFHDVRADDYVTGEQIKDIPIAI